jgi:hypothetical protein
MTAGHRTREMRVDARAKMEAKKRTLLADVERALLDALAESSEVHRALWKLQREGWTLRLVLDCQPDGENGPSGAGAATPPARRSRAQEPTFRIDAEDLRFLRELGIDPTRRRAPRRPR